LVNKKRSEGTVKLGRGVEMTGKSLKGAAHPTMSPKGEKKEKSYPGRKIRMCRKKKTPRRK